MMAFWPHFGEAILRKEKDVELRRCAAGRNFAIAAGDRILIYETAPVSAVAGECVVLMRWAGVPREMIKGFFLSAHFSTDHCLEALGMRDEKEFDKFFSKHTHAHMIMLTSRWRYKPTVKIPPWLRPRSYRTIEEARAEDIWRVGGSPGAAPEDAVPPLTTGAIRDCNKVPQTMANERSRGGHEGGAR